MILDLHWLDSMRRQAAMPDGDSTAFWQDVARTYANDGRVIFELYNEPYPMNWARGEAACKRCTTPSAARMPTTSF